MNLHRLGVVDTPCLHSIATASHENTPRLTPFTFSTDTVSMSRDVYLGRFPWCSMSGLP